MDSSFSERSSNAPADLKGSFDSLTAEVIKKLPAGTPRKEEPAMQNP